VRSVQAQVVYEGSVATLEGDVAVSESSYSSGYRLITKAPTDSWRYSIVKRGIDVLFALAVILGFAIPGLLIAAAIVLTSRGPVFYREERIGRNGQPFRIWKFRSMHRNAGQRSRVEVHQHGDRVLHWRMQKHLSDPRITAVGSFLRAWSLDEVPQFINVLRGEMSLIGPRPIVEAETHLFGDLLDYYLDAKPGLSGLWQVSGRSNVDYARRAQLDTFYVRTWSLWSDYRILLRTIPAVLRREGAR
jgi:undecaprenyl-phosphate galactose phosphotransferase